MRLGARLWGLWIYERKRPRVYMYKGQLASEARCWSFNLPIFIKKHFSGRFRPKLRKSGFLKKCEGNFVSGRFI